MHEHWEYRFEYWEEGLKLWWLRMKEHFDQENIPDYQMVILVA